MKQIEYKATFSRRKVLLLHWKKKTTAKSYKYSQKVEFSEMHFKNYFICHTVWTLPCKAVLGNPCVSPLGPFNSQGT